MDFLTQGQHVTHCGRRASSAKGERITMVTSYVPADPLLPDRRRDLPISCNCAPQATRAHRWCLAFHSSALADPLSVPERSVLRGPRPVSDCGQLYHEWARYRLASLAAQVCPAALLHACSDLPAWGCMLVGWLATAASGHRPCATACMPSACIAFTESAGPAVGHHAHRSPGRDAGPAPGRRGHAGRARLDGQHGGVHPRHARGAHLRGVCCSVPAEHRAVAGVPGLAAR